MFTKLGFLNTSLKVHSTNNIFFKVTANDNKKAIYKLQQIIQL